jgi:glycosyltransferase involved in cell wall biosynthesis
MSSLPRVSVVVPCYNYGQYLPACVESVLGQPGVVVDVLVIDDASPDGSGDVAEALADQHERVRVLRHRSNRGHIATFNEGLSLADGKYLVLLSADDLLTAGALGRATALLEAHESVGLVYGHPQIVFGDHLPPPRTRVRSWSVWPGRRWIEDRCRRGVNCIWSPEVVMRMTVQRQIGDYRGDLPHSADLEMWLRAASVSDVGRVNGPDQAYRRIHLTNMSETTFSGHHADLHERLRGFEAFFAGPGATLPEADRLLGTARRRIATAALDQACVLAATEEIDQEPVDALLRLAVEASVDARRTRQWREVQWRRAARRGRSVDAVRQVIYDARRDLEGRARWRRWHWHGG